MARASISRALDYMGLKGGEKITDLAIDRDTAYRLHLTTAEIDNTLYDAFGQRQVSTIYNALNQYHSIR